MAQVPLYVSDIFRSYLVSTIFFCEIRKKTPWDIHASINQKTGTRCDAIIDAAQPKGFRSSSLTCHADSIDSGCEVAIHVQH